MNDYGNHRKINVGNYKVFGTERVEFMRGTNRRLRSLYLSILINCNDAFESIHFLALYWLGTVANPATLYGNAHSEHTHFKHILIVNLIIYGIFVVSYNVARSFIPPLAALTNVRQEIHL